jgi:hypothetical protein
MAVPEIYSSRLSLAGKGNASLPMRGASVKRFRSSAQKSSYRFAAATEKPIPTIASANTPARSSTTREPARRQNTNEGCDCRTGKRPGPPAVTRNNCPIARYETAIADYNAASPRHGGGRRTLDRGPTGSIGWPLSSGPVSARGRGHQQYCDRAPPLPGRFRTSVVFKSFTLLRTFSSVAPRNWSRGAG